MRKLKLIEHISLDGVIQAGADSDGDFFVRRLERAVSQSGWFGDDPAGMGREIRSAAGAAEPYDMWSGFWASGRRRARWRTG